MVTNSFKNRVFMQPMRWFNMHLGGFIFFSFGGEKGAEGEGSIFWDFGVPTMSPICSL